MMEEWEKIVAGEWNKVEKENKLWSLRVVGLLFF
jgi:hypothetical protein